VTALNSGVEARPPWWPVIAVIGVSLASLALAVLPLSGVTSPTEPLLIGGYVLGAIIAVGLMTVYRALKAQRRSKIFRPSPLRDRLTMTFTLLGVLGGLTCAFLLATEMAKGT